MLWNISKGKYYISEEKNTKETNLWSEIKKSAKNTSINEQSYIFFNLILYLN